MQIVKDQCQVSLMESGVIRGSETRPVTFLVVNERRPGYSQCANPAFHRINHTCAQQPTRPGGLAILDVVNDIPSQLIFLVARLGEKRLAPGVLTLCTLPYLDSFVL